MKSVDGADPAIITAKKQAFDVTISKELLYDSGYPHPPDYWEGYIEALQSARYEMNRRGELSATKAWMTRKIRRARSSAEFDAKGGLQGHLVRSLGASS